MRLPMRLVRVSWRDLALILGPVLLVVAVGIWIALKYARPAPPDRIVITTGAEGSAFRSTAERYRAILARNGVKVEILPSQGALENLHRLQNPGFDVDVGFVQGGLASEQDTEGLVSLGTIYSEPLWIFSRCAKPVDRLSELAGRRIAIGPEGSGTRVLALQLLTANGIDSQSTPLLDLGGEDGVKALREGRADVVFLMGDSAKMSIVRELLLTRGICLMDFDQADAYVRRFAYLNKLTLPMGAIDLGKNVPAKDITLIGPMAELVARENLHPALSDLLIEAAREVHGKPGLFRRAGEFPSPLVSDFPLSDDADRYYKSGKKFLYRHLPFWLGSLADRMLVLLVPVLALLIPGLRIVPPFYRWRVRSRIYRWYGALMALERDMLSSPAPEQRKELLERLDLIEQGVNRIRIPLSFADQVYVLREHIGFVRDRLSALH
jgi:TRAP-type uncharacterized transport system substrate-binding protein